jgi:hypothetical protein
MDVLLDGLWVLQQYKAGIALLLVSVSGWGIWIVRPFLSDDKVKSLVLPLGLTLGGLPLAIITFALIMLGRVWRPALTGGSWFVLIVAVLILGNCFIQSASLRIPHRLNVYYIFGSAAVLVFLLAKLAYLRPLLLPPYNDSPTHYLIVQNLLSGPQKGFYSVETLGERYYHFGFHSLSAWLVHLSGLDSPNTLALIGQVFLFLAPFSIFACMAVITADHKAALFAALLAGLGWEMPGFAANWGKYPALVALSMLPSVICIWFLADRAITNRKGLFFLAAILTLGLAFIHSRAVVILLLAGLSLFLARMSPLDRNLRFREAILITVISLSVWVLIREPVSQYYCSGLCLPLGLTGFLLVFAFLRFPRLSVGTTLFIFFAWLMTQVPTFWPELSLSWIDQPFFQLLIHIPLSVLGGAGMAGLLATLPVALKIRHFTAFLAGAALVANHVFFGSFYPDPCCNYVDRQDLNAIRWIADNIPEDAVVIIPGIRARNYLVGTDAGMWINPLSGANTNKVLYNVNWKSSEILLKVCPADTYIFISDMPYSFNETRLALQAWVRLVYAEGDTRIYRVVDCPPGNAP